MTTDYSNEVGSSPEVASPVSPTSSTGQIPLERPPKLKGRHKLLQSLQRISSSSSLPGRGRSASTGYRRDGKASLSCASLGSDSACLGNGSSSQLYGGLNIPPGTPGSQEENQDGNARIRLVGTEPSNASTPRTIPLPTEVRPGSHGTLVENDTVGENVVVVSQPAPEPKVFDFWGSMPGELKMHIFRYLTPKEIIRCSAVSQEWNKMCYDGQLWTTVDTTDYYHNIPCESLLKIMASGGPFVRDLNLRGCVQLRDKWVYGERITDLCRNVVNFSLEGCLMDKTVIQYFFLRNTHLEYINVSGLSTVTNSAMRIIAQSCPQLGVLNVSWCKGVDTKGLKRIVGSCPKLKDLRASEIRGFSDEEFTLALFERNTLERLVMSRSDLTDESLKVLMHGVDPEIDLMTDRPIVPPRQFKHLDLHQCTDVTDNGVKSLAHNVPNLEGLQLSQCPELSDDSIISVIQTTPRLTHLELEDLERLTNDTLVELAKSPCAPYLEHLNISYCENLGDVGMIQVMKSCPSIHSVEMDNTRVSDLTLMEASFRVRKRGYDDTLPQVGLRLVVFDCANITWAGVKEVLSSNTYIPRSRRPIPTVASVTQPADEDESPATKTPITSSITPPPPPTLYPKEIIQLKCFYGWQMTVDEHNKRVLRGDLAAASRLDRKWAEYMMATEEAAGLTGAGARRRRRRAREAERLYNADEDDDDVDGDGGFAAFGGRRRRAASGGCTVM